MKYINVNSLKAILVTIGILSVLTATAPAQTAKRPVSDWLENQTFGVTFGNPVPATMECAFDYTGYLYAYWKSMETPYLWDAPEITGSVTERLLPDGKAEVMVMVHAKNVFVTVFQVGDKAPPFPDNLLFGNWTSSVCYLDKEPAYGDCTLTLKFINPYGGLGAYLPDLWDLLVNSFDSIKSISYDGQAYGPLIDGSSGFVQMRQTFLPLTSSKANPKSALADMFPAEHIILRRIGK